METRLRTLIMLAGLPEPTVNYKLRNSNGEVVVRLDLSYPGLKLIIEYDGRQHAESSRQWRSDIDRRELLDRIGWRLVIVTAEGIFMDPVRTLRRIEEALRDRGCKALPARLSDEWRPYFPSQTT